MRRRIGIVAMALGALAGLVGCGFSRLSGVYIANEPNQVGLLQLTQETPTSFMGVLQWAKLDAHGKVNSGKTVIHGRRDGMNLYLDKPTWGGGCYGGSTGNAGRILGRSGDDGVDGVIDQDALGLDRVYIQAKRYAAGNNVGAGAIRGFFGSLDRHKASKGVFVTTSSFSPSAKETAEHLSKRIALIDANQLAHLMIRHDVGCRVEETLDIRKGDEGFFE